MEDVCWICKKEFPDENWGQWTSEEGDTIEVGENEKLLFTIETAEAGEIEICEDCYSSNLWQERIDTKYHSDMHYEAGCGFLGRDRGNEAVQAYTAAGKATGCSKAIASLGKAYSDVGEKEKARECYRVALMIDPDELLARNNLAVSGCD